MEKIKYLTAREAELLVSDWVVDVSYPAIAHHGALASAPVRIYRRTCSRHEAEALRVLLFDAMGVELSERAIDLNHIDMYNSSVIDRAVQIQLSETTYCQVLKFFDLVG